MSSSVEVPALQSDGSVILDSEEMHRSIYEPFLARGGLMVATTAPLEALSEIDLILGCACLSEPVSVRAQVVTLMPGRAVLQFLDVDAATLERLRPPAVDAAPPAPPPVYRRPPTQTFSIPGPADLGVSELAEIAPPTGHLDPPVSEPAGRAIVPPILEGELLRFLAVADFYAARPELSTGEIAAALSGRMPAKGEISIRFQSGTQLHPTALRVVVEPRPAGFVWIRFLSPDDLRREIQVIGERMGGPSRPITETTTRRAETRPELAPVPIQLTALDPRPSGSMRDPTVLVPIRLEVQSTPPAPAPLPEPMAAPTGARPATEGPLAPARQATMAMPIALGAVVGPSSTSGSAPPFVLLSSPPTSATKAVAPITATIEPLPADFPPPPMARFADGALRFPDSFDFRTVPRNASGLLSIGAFTTVPIAVGTELAAALHLGDRPLGMIRLRCAYVAPGYAHLMCHDLARIAELDRQLLARPLTTPRVATGTFRAAGGDDAPTPIVTSVILTAAPARWNLHSRGELHSAGAPEQFLMQAVARPPLPQQLERPTASLFLRWLSGLAGTQLVTFTSRGQEYRFVVTGGLEMRSTLSAETLTGHLAEAQGAYSVIATTPSTWRVAGRTRAILTEVLRRQLRSYPDSQLSAGLSFKASRSPRLNERGQGLVPALGFAPGVQRTAKRLLDGQYRVDEVIFSGAGEHGGWELLYLLDLFDGLEWVEPPIRTTDAANPVQEHWKRMETMDHFESLGLHWSSPPKSIEAAYQAVGARYGVGTRAGAAAPEYAEKILARAAIARQALSTREGRIKHRRERYPTVRFDFQLEVMAAQAQLGMMRGEFKLARDLLEGAQDIGEHADVIAALERLKKLETKLSTER